MPEIDRIAERASAIMQRHDSPAARRRRQRRLASLRRRLGILAGAVFAIVVALVAIGLFVGPVGTQGVMIAGLLIALAAFALVFLGGDAEPRVEALATTGLAQLPARIGDWLERQRPALPAPAQRQLDGIALRLDALGPQLQALDPREPAAIEVRRLIGDELPELVRGYQRVPEPLRRQPLDGGRTPDAQLVEGLRVVDEEIERMTGQLAGGDLKALATQQRFLEIKYRGDGALEAEPPGASEQ